MCRLLFSLLFLLIWGSNNAANYLVFFKDKPIGSGNSISIQKQKRHNLRCIPLNTLDLPLNPTYVETIAKLSNQYFGQSRWFNAVCIATSAPNLAIIKQLPFVFRVEPIIQRNSFITEEKATSSVQTEITTETQLAMLQLDLLHANGYTGYGINIAVIDNGFTGVNQLAVYKHLYKQNQIKLSRNFVDPNRSVFAMGTDGDHGSRVFSVLAGLEPPKFVGSAYDANYYLAVTEDMTREGQLEEWFWLMAAEWADSLGVDIITTSLGYATGFTYGGDHTFEEMDEKTTIISKAANLAASKGILVINAVGNEGASKWQKMNAPADADSVLAVGSVDAFEKYSSFSSLGPTYDKRIKPDVVAMGGLTTTYLPQGFIKTGNGTSFATPLIAGLAACLWQVNPGLSNMELFNIIKMSGTQANNPDTFLGNGIPKADSAYYRITGKHLMIPPQIKEKMLILPNPSNGNFSLSFNNYGQNYKVSLKIINSQGKLVFENLLELKKGFHLYPFHLQEDLSEPGIYYLIIEGWNDAYLYENKLLILD